MIPALEMINLQKKKKKKSGEKRKEKIFGYTANAKNVAQIQL